MSFSSTSSSSSSSSSSNRKESKDTEKRKGELDVDHIMLPLEIATMKRKKALEAFYEQPTDTSARTLKDVVTQMRPVDPRLCYSEVSTCVHDGLKKTGPVHFHGILTLLKRYDLLAEADIKTLTTAGSRLVQSEFTTHIVSVFQQVCTLEVDPNTISVAIPAIYPSPALKNSTSTVPDSTSTPVVPKEDFKQDVIPDDYVLSPKVNDIKESKEEVKVTTKEFKEEEPKEVKPIQNDSDIIEKQVKFLRDAIDQFVTDGIVKIWDDNSSKRLRDLGESIEALAVAYRLCSHTLMKVSISPEYYHTLCQHWYFKNHRVSLDRQVIVTIFIHILHNHIKCLNKVEVIQIDSSFQRVICQLKKAELDAKIAKDLQDKADKIKEEERATFLKLKETDLTVGQRLMLDKIRADEMIRVEEALLHNRMNEFMFNKYIPKKYPYQLEY